MDTSTTGVVPPKTPKRRQPMVIEKMNMKEGEMPGATDMTKGTHPEIARRMFYHGRNFTPITKGEVIRQELECGFTWSTQHARMLLEDIEDINAGEKTLMMMWSKHVTKYAGLGQDDLTPMW